VFDGLDPEKMKEAGVSLALMYLVIGTVSASAMFFSVSAIINYSKRTS
jgi:hypothetical protein